MIPAPDPIDRDVFSALVADLGRPAVTFHGRTIGAADWPGVLARAARSERAELLVALAPSLLRATADGRARLAAWAALERPALTEAEAVAWCEAHLDYFGDDELRPVAVAGLVRAPQAVRESLAEHLVVLGIVRARGWTIPTPARLVAGGAPSALIVLGPAADRATMLHELAHRWHAPAAEAIAPLTNTEERALRARVQAAGWGAALEAADRARERVAEACAMAWH